MTILAEEPQRSQPSPAKRYLISEKVEEAIQEVRFCPCCGEAMICVPRLVCATCHAPMDIKCQVYKSEGAWYAECLSLDLLSKGSSETDAVRRLQIAMFSYIATVLDGEGSTKGLIPRRAPLSSWIRYYAHEVLGRLAYLVGGKIPLMIRSVPIQDAAEELKVIHCS
jgi:hypothetical protein